MMGVAAALIIKWNLPAVDPGVGQKINGNQIQDGSRSGHLG
jgi:hypothetical protein